MMVRATVGMCMSMMMGMIMVSMASVYRKMCSACFPRSCGKKLFHCVFVECLCFSFDNFYSSCWAIGQTCAQSVAVNIADQYGLAVPELNGPLMTSLNAKAATVAKFFMNVYDAAFHHPPVLSLCECSFIIVDWE